MTERFTPAERSGTDTPAEPVESAGHSRRRFLGTAAVALAAGAGIGYGINGATQSASAAPGTSEGGKPGGGNTTDRSAMVVPFYGEKQAGITTPQQERLMFAALDMTSTSRQDLQLLLGR